MDRRTTPSPWLPCAVAAVALAAAGGLARAQTPTTAALDLKQAFDAAWARQPEALALAARQDAARAAKQAATSWTPEPVALELAGRTDRLNRNRGSRETELGLAVPIWLPGERSSSLALAEAEGQAVESRTRAAQLRVAANVRETWWQWLRAHIDADLARAQLHNARGLAADVARRQRAGDLARADLNQAEGALAAAQSALAQAEAGVSAARNLLQATTGLRGLVAPATAVGEIEPAMPAASPAAPLTALATSPEVDTHAAVAELKDKATVAQRAAALARTQSRAHPELTLSVMQERGAFGEPRQQTVALGLRIPFGAGARQGARVAQAQADGIEAQAQLVNERDRVAAEQDSALARVSAARAQRAAAQRRSQLALETRGFFDKSFRLGETDLPTRLRVEAEATEAERQMARAGIELAAAISSLRQALGLLPQ